MLQPDITPRVLRLHGTPDAHLPRTSTNGKSLKYWAFFKHCL